MVRSVRDPNEVILVAETEKDTDAQAPGVDRLIWNGMRG